MPLINCDIVYKFYVIYLTIKKDSIENNYKYRIFAIIINATQNDTYMA